MLLCFVDESDQGDFHGFAAVLADEKATKSLTAALNAIVNQAAVDYGVLQTTELHAHPLFHGRDQWAGAGARARVAIFNKVIDAVVGHEVTILLRSVSESRLRERQDQRNYRVRFPPEQGCFQHILQRANAVAQRQGTYALVIADERGDRERHRERFAVYQTEGTPGVYMRTTLDRLLDTVHFAPSHQSRMLQAADMIAFLYRRRQTIREQDARSQAAMDRLWTAIVGSGRVYDMGTWP
ncbi:MAG TPA: DUF3800 domain-containing protein [Pseudonocardiaceae bacterium]